MIFALLKGIKLKFAQFKLIFSLNWNAFVLLYPRYDTPYYHAEIEKMLKCGTSEGGFAKKMCMECGMDHHKVYFSCKGKACPQCGKRYARDSMEKIASRLYLGITYRQVVLTIPEQLRVPFHNHKNQDILYSKFMCLAHPCLKAVIQKFYGINSCEIACIVFIHTNSRNGGYNPHLHIIIGEGTFNIETEKWRPFSFIPMSALKLKWQECLLNLVRTELKDNDLADKLEAQYPEGFYANPGKKDGKVPTKDYNQLIKYLTKYLSSPPIGIARITDFSNGEVEYYYKSHKTKKTEYEKIDVIKFIGKMVQHILPKGFKRVRYYGLQLPKKFKKWFETIARVAGDLIDATISFSKRVLYRNFFKEISGRDPYKCRYCGGEMELVQLYHPDKGMFYDLLST